jgi:hypothetical protein
MIGEQSVTLCLDDLVAFTNPGLQAQTVDDRDVAAFVADQSSPLETMR